LETKVRYLVDTNVWLELLLDQEKSSISSTFFDLIPVNKLLVSDFSIHSIGVILSRLKKLDVFEKFIDDLFVYGQLEQLSLDPIDLLDVAKNMQEYQLDFDDSYQFSIAQKYDLILITFDKDFNILGLKKNSPEEIIKMIEP
jgi:uncharacterized protein